MTQGQFQNDQWTVEDHLELSSAADQVTRTALVADPPFTIGVIGKWGSGKTSILKRSYFMLDGKPLSQSVLLDKNKNEALTEEQDDALKECKDRLKKSHGISNEQVAGARCIWFSPWQYQNEDNPLVALLKEIRSQFTSWQKLKEGAGEFNRRGGLAGLALIEKVIDAAATISFQRSAKVASGTTESIRKAWKEAEPNLLEVSDGQRFHLLFEDAVETVLSADKDDGANDSDARLIIFIDDLDRCEGDQVVRLLEAIKLYLSCSRCVFVLGLDEPAVLNALRHHWSRGDEINREYLEKLFQSRVSVPLPSFANIQAMVAGQLGCHPSIEPYKDKLAKDIAGLCEPNPRKVKNFTNSLCAMWHVLGADKYLGQEDSPEEKAEISRRFLVFQYLRSYHSAVYRLLERQPQAFLYLWQILNAAGTTDGAVVDKGQRLLKDMLYRAFSHVLDHHGEADDKHGTESIDSAIEQFLQRQDKKRSDECFKELLKELFDEGSAGDLPSFYFSTACPIDTTAEVENDH